MVSCPMCGKSYSEHALELHAQAEKMGTEYCCPHCGWAWDPALSNKKPAAQSATTSVKAPAKKTVKKTTKSSSATKTKAAPKKTTKPSKPKATKTAKPKAE